MRKLNIYFSLLASVPLLIPLYRLSLGLVDIRKSGFSQPGAVSYTISDPSIRKSSRSGHPGTLPHVQLDKDSGATI